MSITFRSPTARRIVGALQSDTASWPVVWGATSDDVTGFDYTDNGPSADWEHVEMGGAMAFLDDEGQHWLAHHLLIDTASDNDTVNAVALPDKVLAVIRRELALAQAWDATRRAVTAATTALEAIGATPPVYLFRQLDVLRETLRGAEHRAERAYSDAKNSTRLAMLAAL